MFVTGETRVSVGPAEQMTGSPAKSPLWDINEALGMNSRPTRPAPVVQPSPQPPTRVSSAPVNTVQSKILAEVRQNQVSSSKTVANQLAVSLQAANVAREVCASVSASSSSFLASQASTSSAASYAARAAGLGGQNLQVSGVNQGASGSGMSFNGPPPKRMRASSNSSLADNIVTLGSSRVFITNGSQRSYEMAESTLRVLENRHQFWKAQAFEAETVTGSMPQADFPRPDDYVCLEKSRSPVSNVAKPHIDPSKPTVLHFGDSTLCAGQPGEPGNTFLATFRINDHGGLSIDALSYKQIDLTALGKKLPYNLLVFAISGLSAIHGPNRLSPADLKQRVYAEFGLDDDFRLAEVCLSIGTNDIKYLAQLSETMTRAEAMGENDPVPLPMKIENLREQMLDYVQEIGIAFDSPAIWVSAGVGNNVKSEATAGNVSIFVDSLSSIANTDSKVRFMYLLNVFVSFFIYSSDGVLRPCKLADGSFSPQGYFGSFACIPGECSQTGTGHLTQRGLADWFANLLNCSSIMLCKIKRDDNACTVFFTRGGRPPYWSKDPHMKYLRDLNQAKEQGSALPEYVPYLKATKHEFLETLPEDKARVVTKGGFLRQSCWPAIRCKDPVSHKFINRDSFLLKQFSKNAKPFFQGQICQIRVGFNQNEHFEPGMIIADTGPKYILSSLVNDEVYHLKKNRAAACRHMLLPQPLNWAKELRRDVVAPD